MKRTGARALSDEGAMSRAFRKHELVREGIAEGWRGVAVQRADGG